MADGGIIESELNSMTLDQCAYRESMASGEKKTPTIRLMNILLNEKSLYTYHLDLSFIWKPIH